MKIRKAEIRDLPEILRVYEYARNFMAENGNPTQWAGGYPQEELLREDIKSQKLYVAEDKGHIAAAFYTCGGTDPTYINIEGQWLNGNPYGVIHRIASDGTHHGIMPLCLEFCRRLYDDIKIDTHEDNKIMQHILQKNGFARCGIIYLEDKSPRIAYQYSKSGEKN